MRRWPWSLVCLSGIGLILISAFVDRVEAISRYQKKTNGKSVRKAYGIEKRELWTTSRVVGSPDPPSPYRTEVVFPKLKFDSPLAMNSVPGFKRLVITERTGKIFTFLEETSTSEKQLLIDLKREMRGLAFHPRYQQNGLVYISSLVPTGKQDELNMRVSRYRVTVPNSFSADPKTEQTLVEWPAEGHTGGCIRFGPDVIIFTFPSAIAAASPTG